MCPMTEDWSSEDWREYPEVSCECVCVYCFKCLCFKVACNCSGSLYQHTNTHRHTQTHRNTRALEPHDAATAASAPTRHTPPNRTPLHLRRSSLVARQHPSRRTQHPHFQRWKTHLSCRAPPHQESSGSTCRARLPLIHPTS